MPHGLRVLRRLRGLVALGHRARDGPRARRPPRGDRERLRGPSAAWARRRRRARARRSGPPTPRSRSPAIDLDFIVVEGTDHDSLKKGAGHYPDTADPWDGSGRVGIAGHRTTYLAPFFDLEDVVPGDRITLLTEFGTFDYEVTRNFVIPSAGSGRVLRQTDAPTLVLTTCNPKYSSSERLIVEANLATATG